MVLRGSGRSDQVYRLGSAIPGHYIFEALLTRRWTEVGHVFGPIGPIEVPQIV